MKLLDRIATALFKLLAARKARHIKKLDELMVEYIEHGVRDEKLIDDGLPPERVQAISHEYKTIVANILVYHAKAAYGDSVKAELKIRMLNAVNEIEKQIGRPITDRGETMTLINEL
ncbi:conserved hypothetical protein [Vibrio phage 137E35-1]|nr:conserved hypothetical protein [Vibrio phage 137E35-1]CAH9016631.1 conserved hypothetical protein [Vibrio phage 230E39-1]